MENVKSHLVLTSVFPYLDNSSDHAECNLIPAGNSVMFHSCVGNCKRSKWEREGRVTMPKETGVLLAEQSAAPAAPAAVANPLIAPPFINSCYWGAADPHRCSSSCCQLAAAEPWRTTSLLSHILSFSDDMLCLISPYKTLKTFGPVMKTHCPKEAKLILWLNQRCVFLKQNQKFSRIVGHGTWIEPKEWTGAGRKINSINFNEITIKLLSLPMHLTRDLLTACV